MSMRIRTIKPELYKHDDLYDLENETGLPIRIAYTGLFCASDREGRFLWKPRRLKAEILPYDDIDFSRVLHALFTRGFLVKYASKDGKEYGFIPSFKEHQVINNKETASKLPDPEECEILSDNGDLHASATRDPREDHACLSRSRGKEGKGREGKGREQGKEGKESSLDSSAKAAETKKLNAEFEEIWPYLATFPNNVNPDSARTRYVSCRRAGFSSEEIQRYYKITWIDKYPNDKKFVKQFFKAITIGNLKLWKKTPKLQVVDDAPKDAWDEVIEKLEAVDARMEMEA
jgi:hypothetical protein